MTALAAVVAVRGNVDPRAWASRLATAAVVKAAAVIYVLHDIQELDLDPAAAGFQIVVSGTRTSQTARNATASCISILEVPALGDSDCR
jgi:hypothetical protein